MCGNNHDHDHDHDHDHSHDHVHTDHCCSLGEDYERNLAEQRALSLTRRRVLQTMGASTLLIAGGAINAGTAFANTASRSEYSPQGSDNFDGFFYLSGDHHIHTRYSPDAKYHIERQVAEANYHGLDWMAITDHGNVTHNKIGVDLTYPDLLQARKDFPNTLVFVGLEQNIPGGEHGTVMLVPSAKEHDQIKTFEALYDANIVESTEVKAVEGLKYLDTFDPKPIFFANHPARRGLDSPHEIRNWKAAAPDVAYGFEGAPGHQAAGLIRDQSGKLVAYRGFYGNKPEVGAWPGYPLESYFTYGGFDWMTAIVGGLWDSLLGDGLRWWITANSDSHKYFNDLQDIDSTTFATQGYVTEIDHYFQQPVYGDFRPGEYSRTYVVTKQRSYADVIAGMKAGQVFVVTGDLIDRLKFTATSAKTKATVNIGGTLIAKHGDDVTVTIKVRVPSGDNWHNQRPTVDHIDLIAGLVNHPSKTGGLDTFANPSTKIARTFKAREVEDHEEAGGLVLSMTHTFRKVEQDFYIRLRGTNNEYRTKNPRMDPDLRGTTGKPQDPWGDLWFYSNPIFVQVQP